MIYPIIPVPKPRMSRRDKWLDPPRPPVSQYRNFCTQCRLHKVKLNPSGDQITFVLPIPQSATKKLKLKLDGKPHMQKPDLDNLLKALGDALFASDAIIWNIAGITKLWGLEGKIIIEPEKGE